MLMIGVILAFSHNSLVDMTKMLLLFMFDCLSYLKTEIVSINHLVASKYYMIYCMLVCFNREGENILCFIQ